MVGWVVISIILLCTVFGAGYFAALRRNRELESSWQVIRYAGNSVEPKDVYICKNCNKITNLNYCYCSNCGARMRNGISRVYYSGDIDLSE